MLPIISTIADVAGTNAAAIATAAVSTAVSAVATAAAAAVVATTSTIAALCRCHIARRVVMAVAHRCCLRHGNRFSPLASPSAAPPLSPHSLSPALCAGHNTMLTKK